MSRFPEPISPFPPHTFKSKNDLCNHRGRMSLFLRRKSKLEIDLSEMEDEKESVASFLRSQLKADVTSSGKKVFVDSVNLSPQELRKLVNKYVYHRNLNNRYYAALEKNAVKIKKFGDIKKHGKPRKKATPPSTIKHGW